MNTTCYLIASAVRFKYGVQGIRSVRIARATKNKPNNLRRDEIAVKLNIEIPQAAFNAFEAEATIKIPPHNVIHPVVVEVEDPAEDDA